MNLNLIEAVIFDLDGVITNSTPLHSAAWKTMFDHFLMDWSDSKSIPFQEFTHHEDYLAYVDGKPRYIGVKSFLESFPVQGDAANQKDTESPENQRMHHPRPSLPGPSDQAFLPDGQDQHVHQPIFQPVGSVGGFERRQQSNFSEHRPGEHGKRNSD